MNKNPRSSSAPTPRLFCTPLPQWIAFTLPFLILEPLQAATVSVSNVSQLVNAVNNGAAGDTINVAAGTYLLTASLTPKANMTIRGAGADHTILRNATSWDPGTTGLPDNATNASSAVRSAYLFDFGSNNGIKLSDMTLDGTKKLHGAIFGNNAHNLEIHDLIIKNYRWSGIRTWLMQGTQIFNNQFIDAGGWQGGTTGGMVYGTWTNTTSFFDNTFSKTAAQGGVYGIKGREFRNCRITNNTILVGSFSIELPHENDYWVEIDHNHMDGAISIPKGGGGGTVPVGGYTFHIHHNYMTNGYSVESARRGVIIEYNLFDFDTQKDGSNLISNWTPTIQGPMTMRHNLIKNPGRGIYWSDEIYNNFSFHNNHVIANTTATPRTEGFFGMPTTTDFSTITIRDNIIECIGQSRPLVRNSASNSAVIQNNTLINVSGTANYANPNTGAPRGPDQALFFTVGAFDSHQVDGWDFYPASSGGIQQSLFASADSYVVQGSASSNYGSQDVLLVKHSYTSSFHRRAFLKVPVNSLSSNVAKAELVLTVKSIGGENVTNRPITLRAVTNDAWTEAGVTWNNQPALGETLASFTITAADVGKEIVIDVTNYVNAQRAGDGTASFALVQPNGADALVSFHSREGSAPPRVDVATSVSNLAVNADSHVVQGAASTNYGSQDALLVKHSYTSSFHRRAFLKVPVNSLASSVAKAELVLTVKSIGGENVTNRPITLRAVADDSWSETGVVWNNQPALGETLASFNITAADVGKQIVIDVTNYVNAQCAGDGTASFALVQPNGADALVSFHSREGSAPPMIQVTP